MNYRVAFAGFRHPHIFSLWTRILEHPHCEIVGAWENNPAMRETLKSAGEIALTHDSFTQMLKETECNVVAIGDAYGRRGALAIQALESGCHVISDKPICISLDELKQISELAKERKLSVGCQLDLVETGVIRRLQETIRSGHLGEVKTVSIFAQHPLRYGVRPSWYFEPGQHGGTINDIGIHVFHLMPWLTGSKWKGIHYARSWNAKAREEKHFQDCAQFVGELENGVSCFTDVSYLAPNTLGFEASQYWRITAHGTRGVAETSYNAKTVEIITDEDKEPRHLAGIDGAVITYLQDFLDEIAGKQADGGLTTSEVLDISHWALETQAKSEGK
ncbi:MAG: Gfo/Idh/MocA family protein [Chthoniobacterales bacterium]